MQTCMTDCESEGVSMMQQLLLPQASLVAVAMKKLSQFGGALRGPSSSSMPLAQAKPVAKKRGKPALHEADGPSEALGLKERMRQKLLKNTNSAQEVLDDTLAIWTIGAEVGNLMGLELVGMDLINI